MIQFNLISLDNNQKPRTQLKRLQEPPIIHLLKVSRTLYKQAAVKLGSTASPSGQQLAQLAHSIKKPHCFSRLRFKIASKALNKKGL